MIKTISAILTLAISLFSFSFAQYWIYYWTSKSYAKTLFNYDVMIIQPYNINLFKDYKGKKVCYLTVGEFDGTESELESLWLKDAVKWFNSEWNSYMMDMSNSKWQDYLISQENNLKTIWCNWVFMDTIWQDWQEDAWVTIAQKIKQNWSDWYIVVNNWHYIKDRIIDYVDAYMFENFWDKTVKAWSEDEKWLQELSSEYQNIAKTYNKRIFALSYWNPATAIKWWKNVKAKASLYWFEIIFSNLNLTKIFK